MEPTSEIREDGNKKICLEEEQLDKVIGETVGSKFSEIGTDLISNTVNLLVGPPVEYPKEFMKLLSFSARISEIQFLYEDPKGMIYISKTLKKLKSKSLFNLKFIDMRPRL